jgi:hypothetical protein
VIAPVFVPMFALCIGAGVQQVPDARQAHRAAQGNALTTLVIG